MISRNAEDLNALAEPPERSRLSKHGGDGLRLSPACCNRTRRFDMPDFRKRYTSFSTTGLALIVGVIVLVLVAFFFRP